MPGRPTNVDRGGDGRVMVRGSSQCAGVLFIFMIAGQGPSVLAEGAG